MPMIQPYYVFVYIVCTRICTECLLSSGLTMACMAWGFLLALTSCNSIALLYMLQCSTYKVLKAFSFTNPKSSDFFPELRWQSHRVSPQPMKIHGCKYFGSVIGPFHRRCRVDGNGSGGGSAKTQGKSCRFHMISQGSLVGGLEHFLFLHILGLSSSQLTFIFFKGVETTNQHHIWTYLNYIELGVQFAHYRYYVWMVGSTLQVGSAQDGRQGIGYSVPGKQLGMPIQNI